MPLLIMRQPSSEPDYVEGHIEDQIKQALKDAIGLFSNVLAVCRYRDYFVAMFFLKWLSDNEADGGLVLPPDANFHALHAARRADIAARDYRLDIGRYVRGGVDGDGRDFGADHAFYYRQHLDRDRGSKNA